MTDEVVIGRRFNGPPTSANGGYACGLVAEAIGPAARVSLRAPPPLEVPLTRLSESGSVVLRDGDTLVAEGEEGSPGLEPAESPGLEAAREGARRYPGRDPAKHLFPTCFVCGPVREDGLRVFPGPVSGSELLACPWTPGEDLAGEDGAVDPVFLWAALDCPSGFACMPPDRTSVLASMTGEIRAQATPAREYVLAAWKLGSEGRKHRAGVAAYDGEGACIAIAEALWITIGS